MKNLKEKVKKEFESQIDINLCFDSSTLEANSKKYSRKKIVIRRSILATISIATLCIISIPIIKSLETKETFKQFKKQYSQSELRQIEQDSFKKLNDVTYPESNQTCIVSDEYRNSIIEFSNKIYSYIHQENSSFSPLNLHMTLSILSLASNNEIALSALDNLLGMNKETRENDFINAYINDYYYNSYGTIQMYNGYFSTNEYEENQDFISSLTRHYTEAYRVNFKSDNAINKILDWVDQKVQDKNFLNKKDLEIKESTAFILMSTLYFKNSWWTSFNTKDTKKDSFYLEDGSELDISYLFHSYYGDCYDYGDYISCYDYYTNGSKIKYLIPKNDISKSIFELIQDENIFKDDETRKIIPKSDWLQNPIINLRVPKFENEFMIDFSPILKENGLEYLFNEGSHSFDYVFSNLPFDQSIYLSYVKQKNHISFDEDGTTIKSVTFAMGDNKATAMPPMTADTIEVNLNRPFVYIVYDSNDLPIFVGNVNNPIK